MWHLLSRERERAEREWMCANEWTSPAVFSYIPHSSIRSNWPALSPLFASWSNTGLWFVCLAHPCMQGNAALPPEELLTSILGRLSAQNGHSLHRLSNETPALHLTAEVCQGCSSVLPSLEPAIALVRLESEVVWETELAKKSCYEEKNNLLCACLLERQSNANRRYLCPGLRKWNPDLLCPDVLSPLRENIKGEDIACKSSILNEEETFAQPTPLNQSSSIPFLPVVRPLGGSWHSTYQR